MQKIFKSCIRMFRSDKPVVVIVGPTASGKSSLAISLAQKYDSEVISCDSRQIYKNLEIFSGAVTQDTSGGVKHHLISFLNPGEIYSADRFVEDTLPIIDLLHSKNKIPIVAGGTGFWAQALMFESQFPKIEPDYHYRETLSGLTDAELFTKLEEVDPRRAGQMDPHNRKRLVRALEIVKQMGAVPNIRDKKRGGYKFIFVYLKPEKNILDKRIEKNVSHRIEEGLFDEARQVTQSLSHTQCLELGLGYKYIMDVLDGTLREHDFISQMKSEEIKYAKRQKTFINKLYTKYRGPKVIIESIDKEERFTTVSSMLK